MAEAKLKPMFENTDIKMMTSTELSEKLDYVVKLYGVRAEVCVDRDMEERRAVKARQVAMNEKWATLRDMEAILDEQQARKRKPLVANHDD